MDLREELRWRTLFVVTCVSLCGTSQAVTIDPFVATGEVCLSDFDGDGDVDIVDLGVFGSDYGSKDCMGCAGDFDEDGDVDIVDLGRLGGEYGRTDCPAPTAPRVLVIHDGLTATLDTLMFALKDEGVLVHLSDVDETEYDGTNPPLEGYGTVIHLNANTSMDDMPLTGQEALSDFVNLGGGYISTELTSLEGMGSHYVHMDDLRLFDFKSGRCLERELYAMPDLLEHPIVDGVDGAVIEGCFADVTVRPFKGTTVKVLMEHGDETPSVATRRVGKGRVVALNLAMNLGDGYYDLGGHPDVQWLYSNAIYWLRSLQPGATAAKDVGPSGGTLTLGGMTLTVPAGALSEVTEIRVTVIDEDLPRHINSMIEGSPVFEFEPHGINFSVPAEFALYGSPTVMPETVYWESDTYGFEQLNSWVENGAIHAEVKHFSKSFTVTDPNWPGGMRFSDYDYFNDFTGATFTAELPHMSPPYRGETVTIVDRHKRSYFVVYPYDRPANPARPTAGLVDFYRSEISARVHVSCVRQCDLHLWGSEGQVPYGSIWKLARKDGASAMRQEFAMPPFLDLPSGTTFKEIEDSCEAAFKNWEARYDQVCDPGVEQLERDHELVPEWATCTTDADCEAKFESPEYDAATQSRCEYLNEDGHLYSVGQVRTRCMPYVKAGFECLGEYSGGRSYGSECDSGLSCALDESKVECDDSAKYWHECKYTCQ